MWYSIPRSTSIVLLYCTAAPRPHRQHSHSRVAGTPSGGLNWDLSTPFGVQALRSTVPILQLLTAHTSRLLWACRPPSESVIPGSLPHQPALAPAVPAAKNFLPSAPSDATQGPASHKKALPGLSILTCGLLIWALPSPRPVSFLSVGLVRPIYFAVWFSATPMACDNSCLSCSLCGPTPRTVA